MVLSLLQVAIMAAVAGLTGVLPLSDSGFFAISRKLLGLPLDGSADGMLIAITCFTIALTICVVFRPMFTRKAHRRTRGKERQVEDLKLQANLSRRMLALMFVGIIPAIPCLAFQNRFSVLGERLPVLSVILVVFGFLVFSCDRVGYGKRNLADVTMADGLLVGLFQGLGLIPGLSPVGMAIVMGIWRGIEPVFSVKLACLMYVPLLLIRGVMGIYASWGEPFRAVYLLGVAICGLVSYLALRLMRYVARRAAIGEFSIFLWGGALFAFVLSLLS